MSAVGLAKWLDAVLSPLYSRNLTTQQFFVTAARILDETEFWVNGRTDSEGVSEVRSQILTQKETPRMGDTGNCEVNAARHGALRRPLELRVSRSARVEWAPVPERDPCEPDATVVPGSVRRPRRSSAHGTGWPRNSNSWYG